MTSPTTATLAAGLAALASTVLALPVSGAPSTAVPPPTALEFTTPWSTPSFGHPDLVHDTKPLDWSGAPTRLAQQTADDTRTAAAPAIVTVAPIVGATVANASSLAADGASLAGNLAKQTVADVADAGTCLTTSVGHVSASRAMSCL